jgi:competence protein ComEA
MNRVSWAFRVVVLAVLCLMLAGVAGAAQAGMEGKVDINSASVKELSTIPGIGQKKAESIINYRSEKGEFSSVDDLMKVEGIGKKTLERIKPFVTVQGS